MRWILLISTMLFTLLLKGESNMMLEKANQFYHNKNYAEAIQLYTQLLSDGYEHEVLYYNLGNAYYKTNKTGLSIWCYKKALEFSNNSLYKDNLLLAERKINSPMPSMKEVFFMRWWHAIITFQTSNGWAKWGLVSFLVGIVLLVWRKLGTIKAIPRGFVSLSFIGCLLSVAFSLIRHFTNPQAIVVEQTVFNGNNGSPSGGLSEGIEVTVQGFGKTQALISLPDGRVGSVPIQALREL